MVVCRLYWRFIQRDVLAPALVERAAGEDDGVFVGQPFVALQPVEADEGTERAEGTAVRKGCGSLERVVDGFARNAHALVEACLEGQPTCPRTRTWTASSPAPACRR